MKEERAIVDNGFDDDAHLIEERSCESSFFPFLEQTMLSKEISPLQ